MTKLASCVLVLAACGGGASTAQDAVSDAATGAFPGCAPATPQPPVCTPSHFCWISPSGAPRGVGSISGGGCDYWLGGSTVFRMNGDALTPITAPGAVNGLQVFPTEAWTTGDGTRRFDGVQWTTIDPLGGRRIWGSAPDDVWVRRAFDVARWNGHEMQSMLMFYDGLTPDALSGTAPDDVRVVEGVGIEHWNGGEWAYEALADARVVELWGDTADDWYALTVELTGDSGLWHFDGTGWTRVLTSPQALHAVWGSAPDDVWAGGDGVVLHFDGQAWRAVALPLPQTVLAIHGTGRDDVVFGGSDYVARWDGTRIVQVFTEIPLAPGETRWVGMYGASASAVWTVADRGTVAHWDGAVWRASRLAGDPDVTAIGGAAGEVWIAGVAAGTMHIWRRTGDGWDATDLGVVGTLRSIQAAAANDAWAVGDRGMIFHFDGTAWRQIASPVEVQLTGVWGSAADAWAVGGFTVLHWNASTWSTVEIVGGGPYTSVWGRASNEVYFGGGGGALIRFDGNQFILRSVADSRITSVGGTSQLLWGTAVNSVVLDRGSGPYALATPNGAWFGAYFPSRNDGWIAGSGGALMRYQP